MPSMKAIKRRITSVSNTQQIMKAMNLVATSKVQKNKSRLDTIRPMITAASDFIANGLSHEDTRDNIYYKIREVKKTGYVVISGERGLCGSYNANVLKEAFTHMTDRDECVIAVGAKCKEYFTRRRKNVDSEHVGVLEEISYSVAEEIAQRVVEMYTGLDEENQVEEFYLIHTQFETLLSNAPIVTKLFPFDHPTTGGPQKEIIYEPDVDTYLRKSVPIHLAMFIYGAMIESAVCEQASRMTSMDAAARNAGEINDKLTLQYNRQRQSAITQEISEIVGGVNVMG